MQNNKRIALLLFIITALALIYFFNIPQYLNLATIKQYKDLLLTTVKNNYWLSVLGYILIYIIAIAFSLPGAAALSIAGGFLFGTLPAIPFIVIGATSGAVLAFLSVRYVIGDWLQQRYKKRLHTFNQELKTYGSSYLLSSRLIPIFPFFLINILAALTQIPLLTFTWTTAIGIIPSALVFSFAGSRLHEIESVKDIFTPEVLLAFLLLSLFALLPVIIKRLKKLKV